ncbi:glycosyltransferase family 2 protein [Ramlibacter sp. AW1]|uniref:Glycosyltransferase family 2 protein n=2 Tax=Ramlibacter aurantiacus TaxID=2801330 RepID=A0A936ZXF0_9BURK|nr:glycosyltransferase family 2 protein [Ramlibacter aurantiacus]
MAIVSPCYNEQAVLPLSIPRLLALLSELEQIHGCSGDSYVLLIDDGSRDLTWPLIKAAAEAHPGKIRGLRLARNAGHQYALLAGLEYVTNRCDAVISIDADLQDDLDALPKMIAAHRAGAEIVLGVKESRTVDPAMKKVTAAAFYKLMKLMGVNLVENHADCRLLSARALTNLAQFPERLLFLRGLQPLVHGRIATVHYHLSPRLAGESKYPLKKMLSLAWNGITSFSTVPLRLISWTGAIVCAISVVFAGVALVRTVLGQTLPGWASITVPLYLLGGLLMLSIGVVGEYVGKIFVEVKQRPRFLVDEVADDLLP